MTNFFTGNLPHNDSDYVTDQDNFIYGVVTDPNSSGLIGSTSISRITTQKWIIKY